MKSKTSFISIIISILLGVIIVSGTYYYSRIYESPEECFVRKIIESAKSDEQKLLAEKFISESNPKLSVSASKAYLSETSKNDSLRFAIKTYLDYCKVK